VAVGSKNPVAVGSKETPVAVRSKRPRDEPCAEASRPQGRGRAVLVGLHTCGNLASAMLRAFPVSPRVAAIVNVGCCYNYLTVEALADGTAVHRASGGCAAGVADQEQGVALLGFPMSQHIGSLAGLELTRNGGLMLACQAVHRWATNVSTAQAFQLHFFRALLQLVLQQHHPSHLKERQQDIAQNGCVSKQHSIGRIPPRLARSWETYLPAALERLQLPLPFDEEQVGAMLREFQHVEAQVSVYWTLRAVLAPVVETLILLDRALFLHEAGVPSVRIVPVFKPEVSPRNFAIIALKV